MSNTNKPGRQQTRKVLSDHFEQQIAEAFPNMSKDQRRKIAAEMAARRWRTVLDNARKIQTSMDALARMGRLRRAWVRIQAWFLALR